MKNMMTVAVAILVVLVLMFYMFTFQVRYDENAVLTTFGRAAEARFAVDGSLESPGSLKTDAGLYFKWPVPIQQVYRYSDKLRIFDDRKIEIQTADNKAVILSTYVIWRINDPLAFYRGPKNVDEAQNRLEPLVRNLSGAISSYSFDEMVNVDPEKVRLPQIEAHITQQLRDRLISIQPGYGIEVVKVGFRRLILPEATTERVFERMIRTRETLAQTARSEGEAEATSIESSAQEARAKILAFAESRAKAIRDRGDREAAAFLSTFRENEEFATFLFQLDALRQMLANNTTFVLDADDLDILRLFRSHGQDVVAGASSVQE